MYRQIRDHFAVTLKTAEGHKFRGEFGDPNAYPRPRKEIQNLPHRALVTGRKAVAKAGDLVTHDGVKFLLCGQHTLRDTKRFLAVEINDHVAWSRVSEVIDPVTKMAKDTDPVELDPALPITVEPTRSFEEAKFQQSMHRIFTAADLKEGDYVNDMKVMRVDKLFGVTVAEVV